MVKLKFFAQFLAYQCSYPNIPIFYILFKSVYDLIRLGRFFYFLVFCFCFSSKFNICCFSKLWLPLFLYNAFWWTVALMSYFISLFIRTFYNHFHDFSSTKLFIRFRDSSFTSPIVLVRCKKQEIVESHDRLRHEETQHIKVDEYGQSR